MSTLSSPQKNATENGVGDVSGANSQNEIRSMNKENSVNEVTFIHLHTHSHYSLLDGLSKVDDIVGLAKKYDMPAVALTDHGAMYGAIEFYKACTITGIKPIIGVEAYIANRRRVDKEPGIDNKRFHLTLLAKNNAGYRNLVKLTTLAHIEGYYYKPRMDKDILREYSEGLIALSGCPAGELGRALQHGKLDRAEEIVREYQEIFGKENYFLEIMAHPEVEFSENIKNGLLALSKKLDIPLVATQDSHCPTKEHAKAHKTLVAISTHTDVSDTAIFSGDGDYHFISTEEALEKFRDIPEAVANTMKVAAMCDVTLELGKWVFPHLEFAKGDTADDELTALAEEGFAFRELTETPTIRERLRYELEVITNKGYAPYFLVVADLMKFSREHNIYTTVRGSAAGSLVAYLTGITNVDPMEFQLPFERFLNPFRPSPPDIDMDFADNRREEVLDYAKRKYGAEHVAQIGTFGTMMARGAVRDVARAMGKPYDLGDRIAKLIPVGSQGFPMTIDHAMELEPDLKRLYDTNSEVREIVDIAKKLEGCVRHVSVHAAGVVISPTPLIDFVPTQYDPKGGKVITQYDMYSVEDAGLLKFDFLGIRNLAILGDAVRLVKEHRGLDINIEKIPFDDKKTFAMLARGETIGLFQLNGTGMTKHLMEMRPTRVLDINVMVALYRPGPMQTIDEYVARKNGKHAITYYHPKMKKFLDKTYGLLVYQDDLLFTAMELAGYDWGEVDKFRKAVGKKIPAEMAKQHKIFVAGCQKHSGMTAVEAEKIWQLFEPFQGYGFNKAHAACYGRVAYQTGYMKANFPTEYMTAVLSAESGDTEKIFEVITECKRMGIPVLPPDINASYAHFTVIKASTSLTNPSSSPAERDATGRGADLTQIYADLPAQILPTSSSSSARDNTPTTFAHEKQSTVQNLGGRDQIRFGLYTIKNLGEAIGEAIIAERVANGPYLTFSDFLERVQHKDLNKKSLESLIRAGAFDSLGEERGALLHNVEAALEYHKEHGRARDSAQVSLFAVVADQNARPQLRLRAAPEISMEEKLAWEKELLGLYVSGHPLEKHREKLEKGGTNIKQLSEDLRDGMNTIIAGIIEDHKMVITKKNEHMVFMKIADFTGSIEVVVFPRTFAECKDLIGPDKMVAIKGRFSRRNDAPSIIAEKVRAL
ncbi:MAG: DNA polymerase III subunit alpha [Candidatus Lloydbacteria bacterium RIFCSPHIGHO2_02_FULL_50_13]|uniref:DNA polymerase III subunit alpha n=1 Tax=Candidatus Lloydbacteria bacterium RIFCSPHIGHO2_02_FULL_50_13 TaxID=1798661 RepID=A0A1G2D1V0_9BACT|nr:MAG: DNA polymerase III subunit alpha [Candidatus Lloydbacteria bacterium RIFCSPHIGHO2_02_FULL_50_13]